MATTERDRAADELVARRESLRDAALARLEVTAVAPRSSGDRGTREALSRCRVDLAAHIDALAAALHATGAEQLREYCAFTAVFLEALGVPRRSLGAALDALSESIGEQLDPALSALAQDTLAAGRERLCASPLVTPAALAAIPEAPRAASEAASAAEAIELSAARIAPMSVALSYMRRPEDALAAGAQRGRCLDDARRHLAQLAAAVDQGSPELFSAYAAWAQSLLVQHGLDPAELVGYLDALGDVLALTLPEHLAERPRQCLAAALDRLTAVHAEAPSFVRPEAPLGAVACGYLDALLARDRRRAVRVIREAIDAGMPVKDIYAHVLQPCQYEVGRRWQLRQLSIAGEHYCTAVTQMILSQLYPLVVNTDRAGLRLVATAVDGNLHEIGARFVADFFEMAGWDTFYLGASTPAEHVIEEVVHRKADVLAISAALGDQLASVREVITATRRDDRCRHVVILVGGRPFCVVHDLWRQLGADGSALSAEEAVRTADQILAARSA
ncbi:cobalamin B12-binding domain-containing protein [Sorangium sp. So ce1000]|uniref:cobalamin B12-binding domain-containing protein n=1 Tax=Sorangium sp. So ce1000 TaxID=3133325 RepID=UPI003F605110